MIQYPHCKINLGLSILAKRSDGYHELETVFYPLPLKDILEITPIQKGNFPYFTFSGLTIPGDNHSNLCIKAYQLLKTDFPSLPNIQMHLHKIIPMGAGLGGGSSDGSTALTILNNLFELNLSIPQLIRYATELGSDCPYFLWEEPCHATGKGEILQPIALNLSQYTLVLLHPNIHIATPWAFQQIIPQKKEKNILTTIHQPIETWKQNLINDFEAPVMLAHPLIAALKTELYQQGAIYASMTGSGSSLFGIFEKNKVYQRTLLNSDLRMDTI